MAVVDGSGVPISVHTASASPHEIALVGETIRACSAPDKPKRLIGDRAYDSDALDTGLREGSIEMITPHRKNRKKPKTQDGCKLKRHARPWKVERLFAWLGNFRRLVVRYERRAENFLGFVQLGCIVILLKSLPKCL